MYYVKVAKNPVWKPFTTLLQTIAVRQAIIA